MATDREYATLTVEPGTCGWKTGTALTGASVCGKRAKYRVNDYRTLTVNGEVCGVHVKSAARRGIGRAGLNTEGAAD
jgi:hypothetical protein